MKLRPFITIGFATWLLFLSMMPAAAAPRQVMHGHVPAVVAHLQPTGNFAGTNRLNLAIGLPLRNQEALTNLLRQIYDPASPNYRHYLTPEQFTEQFGPTEKDYQAVDCFCEGERPDGDRHASQSYVGGCERVGGGHRARVACDAAGLSASDGETDVSCAGCRTVAGSGGSGFEHQWFG